MPTLPAHGNSFEQDGDKMATALQENKSLQERIDALHIQLRAANEEQQKSVLNFIQDDDDIKLTKSQKPHKPGLF